MRLPRLRAWPALLAALPALAAALAWLAGSEAALRLLARQAASLSGGTLAIEGVQGSLYGPLRIAQLRLESEEKRVELHDLRLDWSPRALWQRHLRIGQLELLELRITERKPNPEPPLLPDSLRLPLSLELPGARIQRLRVKTGAGEWRFEDIEFGLDKPANHYRLDLRTLRTPWGRLELKASLAEAAPFEFGGQGRFLHASGQLTAQASGHLDRIRLVARAALAGGQGEADLLLTPFATRPVQTARIDARNIDPAAWDKSLPAAALSLRAILRAHAAEDFSGELTLDNTKPGTWDQARLPLKALNARIEGNLAGIDLRDLALDLGRAGRFTGGGRVEASGARLDLHSKRFDPRGLHGRLHSLPLAGAIQLRGDPQRQWLHADLGYQRYRLQLDSELHARVLRIEQARLSSGAGSLDLFGTLSLEAGHPFDLAGALQGFDPAAYGAYPKARINASFNAAGQLAPAPEARLIFAIADSHFRRLPLAGQGQLRVAEKRLWDSTASLRLGDNRLTLRGAFGRPGDRVALQLDARQLEVIHAALSGRIEAQGQFSGDLARPAGELDLTAGNLGWGQDYQLGSLRAKARIDQGLEGHLAVEADLSRLRTPRLQLARASVSAAGKRGQHSLRLAMANPEIDLEAELAGGLREQAGKPEWAGRIERLLNRGRFPLTLLAPARLRIGDDLLALEAADFTALGGRFKLRDARHQGEELRASGAFSGLALTALTPWIELPGEVGGTLVLSGDGSIVAGETLSGELELSREQGDLVLAGQALGLKRLRLRTSVRDNQLQAELEAHGNVLGQLRASGETRLSRRNGAWGIAGDAPLQARAEADLHTLAWTAPLLRKQGIRRPDGRLTARMQASGSLAAPRLQGTLAGERLTLALPEHGLDFRDGNFQAEWQQDTLELKQLNLRAGDGSLSGKGRLALRDNRPDLRLDLRMDTFKVISRPDRLLILSGDGKLALEANSLRLDARLKADRGQFELAPDDAPSLSEDVVVLGRETPARSGGLPWDVALNLDLDLGDRFTLRARGLDAQLAGNLRLAGRRGAPPRAHGSIRVVKGAYAAYGQRLDIERGILNFQGPLDNPGLNIAAMRRGLAVEAGVSVTGTAQAPVVRLISTPPLPDSEKLSWLVLGHGINEAGGQEFDLMQLAAGALLGAGESVTLQQRIAHAAGLEEVSLKGAGNLESTVLTLGKRLSSRAYLSYEQGLAGSEALVRINYTLTRRVSLRAQAGTTSALDVFYTFSFD